MTEVAFHFNAPDKLNYACRLLRKACAASAQVVVTGSEEDLLVLDKALWTFDASAFIPHCFADAPETVLSRSPIVLTHASALNDALPHHEVMINLGQTLVQGFETFERVIEVVTTQEEDKALARKRWRHYAERGYSLVRHDVGQKKSANEKPAPH